MSAVDLRPRKSLFIGKLLIIKPQRFIGRQYFPYTTNIFSWDMLRPKFINNLLLNLYFSMIAYILQDQSFLQLQILGNLSEGSILCLFGASTFNPKPPCHSTGKKIKSLVTLMPAGSLFPLVTLNSFVLMKNSTYGRH